MQHPTPTGGQRSRRQDVWPVAGLLLLGVGLPLLIGVIAGSLEIPRNDDWSYRRIALDLARTGRFALDGISETMIIGQILITQPLLWLSGLQPWAFTVAGVFFAAAGILSAYALARCLLPAGYAALAAALLAIFPGYLAYATSYMSDVPALAAQFICLALGMTAVRHRPVRTRWLLASAAVGIFAFSIREFAVAAPASVMFAAILVQRRRMSTWILTIAVAACCVAVHLWRASVPGQLPPVVGSYGSFSQSTQALSIIALVLAPAALIGALRWYPHWRRIDVLIGVELGGILVGARLLQWVTEHSMPPILLDNLASQWGVPTHNLLVGDRPLLFPDAVWTAVNLLALVASVIILGACTGIAGAHLRRISRSPNVLLDRLGSRAGVLVIYACAMTAGLVVFALWRPIFDRYYWPLVPPVATLLLFLPGDLAARHQSRPFRPATRLLTGSAVAMTVVLATMSIVYTLNGNADDVARWRAGERLVALGISADQIHARAMSGSATTRHGPLIEHGPCRTGSALRIPVAFVPTLWARECGYERSTWRRARRDLGVRAEPHQRSAWDPLPLSGREPWLRLAMRTRVTITDTEPTGGQRSRRQDAGPVARLLLLGVRPPVADRRDRRFSRDPPATTTRLTGGSPSISPEPAGSRSTVSRRR